MLLPLDVHLGVRTSAEHAQKSVFHADSARLHTRSTALMRAHVATKQTLSLAHDPPRAAFACAALCPVNSRNVQPLSVLLYALEL